MKKSIIVISTLICFSLSLTTKAQDSVKLIAQPSPSFHMVEFGFRFMPTFSSFNMQTSSGGTVKGEVTLGTGVGGMLGFNFSNNVGLQGEIIYNSLSQKYKDQGLQRKINIRYVNIPLLLSLNTGKANPVNLNVVVGPQMGFNIGSSISSSGNSTSDTIVAVISTKKGDFGFAYGAGLEFALNSTRTIRMDIGFRGVYGFVKINNPRPGTDNNTYYVLKDATVRTNAGYIGLSFLF